MLLYHIKPATTNLQKVSQIPDENHEQQVSFGTHEAGDVSGMTSFVDRTTTIGDVSAELGSFLSRPVLIHEGQWAIDTPTLTRLDVWKEFLTDTRVRAKIQGFNALRGNLHIKIQIAGSPFYSGRLMASYWPLAKFAAQKDTPVGLGYAPIIESQRIRGFIDPSTNEGCEILCPFWWPYNAIDIVRDEDASCVGTLTIRDVAQLRSIANQSENVTFKVYAWMTETKFIGQTIMNANPQMATEADQPGPISKVASSVADIAGNLQQAPVIGPYATTTKVVADTVGQVAKTFGFSRPVNSEDPTRVVSFTTDNMATTNERDAAFKLAIDAKNEVSVDPRLAGFEPVDELAISNFCRRESFLTKCRWTKSDSIGTILFHCKNSPILYDHEPATENRHFTPLCYAANLFYNWRGSIEYRFVVCSTGYHKGKLRVTFDSDSGSSLSDPSADFNAAENFIVDLSENREFTVRVGWAAKTLWKDIASDSRDSQVLRWGANSVAPFNNMSENQGILSVRVLNELRAPQDTSASDSDLEILVFVRAGPDFQLGRPSEYTLSSLEVPSPIIPFRPESLPGPNTDEGAHGKKKKKKGKFSLPHAATVNPVSHSGTTDHHTGVDHVFANQLGDDGVNLITFGEKITSLRPLMKRYNNYTSVVDRNNTEQDGPVYEEVKIWEPAYPRMRGVTSQAYPAAHMTALNYITACFVGWRGSVRTRYIDCSVDQLPLMHAANTVSFDGSQRIRYFQGTSVDDIINSMRVVDCGNAGFNCTRDGVMMIESPFYCNVRFLPAQDLNHEFWPRQHPHISWGYATNPKAGTIGGDSMAHVRVLKAAGDDFNVFGFCGVPLLTLGEFI